MSIVYTLCSTEKFMSKSTVYVSTVQFMSAQYSLCPKSTVYVPIVQFIFPEYSLCPNSQFRS